MVSSKNRAYSLGDKMGLTVLAKCSCGLEKELLVGGGMDDFTSNCLFPCLCGNCHSIAEVNLLTAELVCPKCGAFNPIPYDASCLSDSIGQRRVAMWDVQDQLGRTLVLTDGKYKCPKCENMSLEFKSCGFWD